MTRLNKTKQSIWTLENNQLTRKKDVLATEEPLEILLRAGNDQRTLAITMRTPGSDYDLAAGFLYNEGISRSAMLVDLGAELDIVEKSGAWYSYGDLRLGQGKENARQFLVDNQDVADEVEARIRAALELRGGLRSSDGDGGFEAAADD